MAPAWAPRRRGAAPRSSSGSPRRRARPWRGWRRERRNDSAWGASCAFPPWLGPRDAEDLPGMDQVRVLDLVAIGLEDPPPLVGVAVEALGDLRQAVAGHDRVLRRGGPTGRLARGGRFARG